MNLLCPPLPFAPPFDVYGLSSAHTVDRWLDIWNRAPEESTDLAYVVLGHGDRSRLAWFVSIGTHVEPRGGNGEHKQWTDAATHALFGQAHLLHKPSPNARDRGFYDDLALAEQLGQDPSNSLWDLQRLTVDGLRTEIHVYQAAGVVAAVGSVGRSALSIYGRIRTVDELEIVVVNEELAKYDGTPPG